VLPVAPALLAQWPAYPSGTVPKNAKGEPDMDAPVPRTPDGKPDFSGLWRGAPRADAARRLPSRLRGHRRSRCFRDVAQNFPGGLPIKPEFAAIKKERQDNNSKDNPEAFCLPMGLMQFHTQGFPRKFIQTPKLLVILYEASYGIRPDLSRRPPAAEQTIRNLGTTYSTGRWKATRLSSRPLVSATMAARYRRHSDDRAGQDDRAVPSRQLWADGDRHHD
jgi:hypothetical protein